ncbi:hypothetical protein [Rhizomicrobium electricum]|uniref:Lipoprotein n=1 Tax=Rhizomicrobium electricum TaxID=480070 RepID=A0ABP3Q9Z1_9PROT|nr:hypothetical protein [Rhizomicrobium electricum]NIJ49398.1 hypothetical protein [Rhizomicrobium electricum]
MVAPFRFSRRFLLASAAALAWTPRSFAEDGPPGSAEFDLLMKEGRYLPLLRFYQSQGTTAAAWLTAQLAAMTGDEAAAFAVPDSAPRAVPDLADCRAVDALETIVQAARSRQIVILNEAHHASRCRAFAAQLAARLHGEGFTVFAGEAFDNSAHPSAAATALNAGGSVTPQLGWYLADPVYAEMVRAMRRRGTRFAAYEARAVQLQGTSGDSEIEAREDAEANNFIADVLGPHPKARVLVLCGYDHVVKTATADGRMWFAARLKAKTGIDPLCVAQSWGLPSMGGEEPALKAVLDTFAFTAPAILFDKHDRPFNPSLANTVDVEVIHPRLAAVDGRPGWLATGRKRAPFALSALVGPHDLIQAVPAEEAAAPNVVPADQYPLLPGAREAVFFLHEGRYEVRLETDDGRRVLGELKV